MSNHGQIPKYHEVVAYRLYAAGTKTMDLIREPTNQETNPQSHCSEKKNHACQPSRLRNQRNQLNSPQKAIHRPDLKHLQEHLLTHQATSLLRIRASYPMPSTSQRPPAHASLRFPLHKSHQRRPSHRSLPSLSQQPRIIFIYPPQSAASVAPNLQLHDGADNNAPAYV